jgi:predicted RNA-binding protein with PIN domain
LKKGTSIRSGKPLYIVDGYNVILSRKFFTNKRSLEEAREYLTRLIDSYASRKMIEVIVVWDGDGGYRSGGQRGSRVKNVYSSMGQSADSRIVKMVEKMPDRKRTIVVSDDRRHITGITVNLGARSLKVKEFLDLLGVRAPSKRKTEGKYYGSLNSPMEDQGNEKKSADDLSVNQWLQLFKSRKM